MKFTQSILERGLYLLLVLLFVTNFAAGFVLYDQSREIRQVISTQSAFTDEIKKDQTSNALAIKTYIACLLTIAPTNNVTIREQICFDNAPPVK